MLVGIRDISVITTPENVVVFDCLLGCGAELDIHRCYEVHLLSLDGQILAFLLDE